MNNPKDIKKEIEDTVGQDAKDVLLDLIGEIKKSRKVEKTTQNELQNIEKTIKSNGRLNEEKILHLIKVAKGLKVKLPDSFKVFVENQIEPKDEVNVKNLDEIKIPESVSIKKASWLESSLATLGKIFIKAGEKIGDVSLVRHNLNARKALPVRLVDNKNKYYKAAFTSFGGGGGGGIDPVGIKGTIADRELYIWGSGGITAVDEVHWRIKQSKEWLGGNCWSGVTDGNSVYLHIKTGAKTAHGKLTISSDGKCLTNLYEDPDLGSDGGDVAEFCMNRETDATPVTELFTKPAITDVGTELECGLLGRGGKKTVASGVLDEAYWFLKSNSSYLLKATNDSGEDSNIVVKYEWHEHDSIE